MDQEGLVTLRVKASAGQETRLMRGPAEIQAADHAQDSDPAQADCSSGGGWTAQGENSSTAMIPAPTPR